MNHKPLFSVIAMFNNNEERVSTTLSEIETMLDGLRLYGPAELILVDEASVDRTLYLLHEAAARLGRFQCRAFGARRGYSQALRVGLAASSGSIICTLDGASTYRPAEMVRMIELMNLSGCDIVTGSPYHPWANLFGRHAPARFLSKLINRVYRECTGTNLYCYTCFFRACRREWLERARSAADGYAAVAELLIEMARQGASIVEYPISLTKANYGETTAQTMEVVVEHLRVMRRLLLGKKPAVVRVKRRDNPLAHWALTGRCIM